MVNLVEIPSGKRQAARKKNAKKKKGSSKKTATKKKVFKKKVVQKKPSSSANKILNELKKLDKNSAAVAPLPAKKMIEELEQLASLENRERIIVKPKTKKSFLEETFLEPEKLKDKKIDLKKENHPQLVEENPLENFEELKMEEVIEQAELIVQPDSFDKKIDEKKDSKPVAEKRNLLRELEKLTQLESITNLHKKEQDLEIVEKEKESEAYDLVLEKFESLQVESSRVKVEVAGAEFEGSEYQSKLRAIPDLSKKTDPKSDDQSYVFSGREGTPGSDIQSIYVTLVQEKVYKNWRDPLAERHSKETIISFHIFPQGNIDKPFIKKSSGVGVLDTLAVRAVLDSVPFPVFPKNLKRSNLFLSIYFKYVPKDN